MSADAVARAEALLKADDSNGALAAAEAVLGDFDLKVLARAAVVSGKALMAPFGMMKEPSDSDEDLPEPSLQELYAARALFQKAARVDPQNAEAKAWLAKFVLEPPAPECQDYTDPYDVVVVGAGASGIGVALMLTATFGIDKDRVLLVERGERVGETFRRWPKEMRFISPSFNQQGWTKSFDLNSVAYGTSPAFTLHAEHPTGEQYARYLSALAEHGGLTVQTSTEVTAVRPKRDGGFDVDLVPADQDVGMAETLHVRYVIWAAGEFQYPGAGEKENEAPVFPGSELCRHNSSVRSWAELPGDDFVVIGGYESGMDAAFNLSSCGKRCSVVASTPFWSVATSDPSTELAPYTAERVRQACASAAPPRLLAPLRVFAVERQEGGFLVRARAGPKPDEPTGTEKQYGLYREPLPSAASSTASPEAEGTEMSLRTPQPPLLCTGFGGGIALGVVKDLFEWGQAQEESKGKQKENEKDACSDCGDEGDEKKCAHDHAHAHMGKKGGCAEGSPLLTEHDESTKTPGLFLVGPAVRHGELSFCFVYKFRQRFGIVADAIARGLGYDTEETVEKCRSMDMFLDDFACCEAACGEVC